MVLVMRLAMGRGLAGSAVTAGVPLRGSTTITGMIAVIAVGMMFPTQNTRWATRWIGILEKDLIPATIGIRCQAPGTMADRIGVAMIPASMTAVRILTIRHSAMAAGILEMMARVVEMTAAFEFSETGRAVRGHAGRRWSRRRSGGGRPESPCLPGEWRRRWIVRWVVSEIREAA